MNHAMLKSDKQEWGTPPDIFADIARRYGPFALDVCALHQTAKCAEYYTPQDDGLSAPWHGICWCNPPYNKLRLWIEKGYTEIMSGRCKRVVYLITARPDTIAWQDYIIPYATHIHFLRGRLRFIDHMTLTPAKDLAMFPSAVVVFDAPLQRKDTPLLWKLGRRAVAAGEE